MGNIENSYLDTFSVRNNTNKTVTLGDLVHCSVPPNKTIDLLKLPRVTKEKINQSQHLKLAISAKILTVIKPKPVSNPVQEQEMIIPDFEDIDAVSRGLKTKSAFISDPTASESIAFWFTEQQIQMVEIRGVTDLGTVTFNIVRAPASTPYAGGSAINSAPIVADTNGQTQAGFAIAAIGSGFWITFESSAISGGVTKLNVTIAFRNTTIT